MTPFTDDDLARVKAKCLCSFEEHKNKEAQEILALINRLEAAEKALDLGERAIYSVCDPYKNDCPFCDNFLGPCKDYCDFPKFHEAFEFWRKATGK